MVGVSAAARLLRDQPLLTLPTPSDATTAYPSTMDARKGGSGSWKDMGNHGYAQLWGNGCDTGIGGKGGVLQMATTCDAFCTCVDGCAER